MVAGIRVHQLAKELGVRSNEVIARCKKNGLGTSIVSAQSIVRGDILIAIRSWYTGAAQAAGQSNRKTAPKRPKRSATYAGESGQSKVIEPYEVLGGSAAQSAGGDVYEVVDNESDAQADTAMPMELLLAELAAVRAIVEQQLVPAVCDLQKIRDEAVAPGNLEGVLGASQSARENDMALAVASHQPALEKAMVFEEDATVELLSAPEVASVTVAERVVPEPAPGMVEGAAIPATAAVETALVVADQALQRVQEATQALAAMEMVQVGGEMQVVTEQENTAVSAVQGVTSTVVNQAVEPLPQSPQLSLGAGQTAAVEDKQATPAANTVVTAVIAAKAPLPQTDENKPASTPVAAAPDTTIGPVAQVRPVVDCAVMGEKKKSWLPRIRLGKSLGIYLSENKLVWTLAEKLPMGVRIAETFEQPITRTEWAAGVAQVLEKYLVGRAQKSMRVVIGLPASQIFFATLPQSAKGETAEALLTNNNCCSSIPATDLCCGLVSLKVMGKTFASVGAARRKEIAALTEVGRKAGSNMVRVEPAPWALLRLGSTGKVANKTVMRLYVNGTELVAVLAQGSHPLLWRGIELSTSSAEAADSILSLARTFETYAQQHVGLEEISSITLQGDDIPERLPERLQAELGAKFSPIAGPGPTALAISKGLAMGGLQWEKPALDLASSLAPPPHLADLVPYGELAVMASLVVCSGLWLWWAGNEAQARAKHAEDANVKNVVLKTDDSKLQQEKTMLSSEVQSVSKFLSNRVLWTEYLNQLSARIPPNVTCLQMQGDYEMSTGAEKNEKKLKRSFQVDFTANLAKDVSAPPEVDHVLASLRQSPVIKRDFPEMKLASLRVNKVQKRGGDGTDPATFTVSCMPKAKPAAAAPAPGAGGDAAKP